MTLRLSPIFTVIFALLVAPSSLWAADAAKGKALYEGNCTTCHDTKIHTRPDRIIYSYTALKNRVRFCESNAKLNWNDQQVEDTAAYLNEAFYKFKP